MLRACECLHIPLFGSIFDGFLILFWSKFGVGCLRVRRWGFLYIPLWLLMSIKGLIFRSGAICFALSLYTLLALVSRSELPSICMFFCLVLLFDGFYFILFYF